LRVPERFPRSTAEHRAGWRFCALFALLAVAIFAALYAVQDTLVAAINLHVAWVAAALIGALGPGVVSGLFASAVWAYPASVRARALGTLVGVAVLYAVNLLRVISLLGLGLLARDWFDLVHLYVWQAVFFSIVAACWLGWIFRLTPRA
jgi:exosortase/archaeosortase family protein